MGTIERKLMDLGIDLPNPPKPSGGFTYRQQLLETLCTLLVQGVK